MATVKDIVESAMPGWRVEEDSKAALDAAKFEAVPPDQVGKSDMELKRKYLSKSRASVRSDAATSERTVEPAGGRLKFSRIVEKQAKDAAVGPKTVLVDTVSGKVKAAQG
jgi:hypothetical protein